MVPSYDHQRQPATPTAMKSWPSSPSSECGRANLDADGESSHPSRPTQSLPGGGVNCPHLDGLLVPTLGPRTGPHSVAAHVFPQDAQGWMPSTHFNAVPREFGPAALSGIAISVSGLSPRALTRVSGGQARGPSPNPTPREGCPTDARRRRERNGRSHDVTPGQPIIL